jgi:hypothetical protein
MKRDDRPGRRDPAPRRRRPATSACPACAGTCTQPIERPTDHDCRTAAKRRRRDR